MNLWAPNEFLRWAAERDIGVNPKYAHDWPRNLWFSSSEKCSRYWAVPASAAAAFGLIEPANDALGPCKQLFIWPRSQTWPANARSDVNPLVRTIGSLIPPDPDSGSALVFEEDDVELALSVLYCSLALGESPWTDLYVVADGGGVILLTDHHEALHAKF